MNRRDFLKNSAALAAAQTVALPTMAASRTESPEGEKDKAGTSLIDSEPMLQNYA